MRQFPAHAVGRTAPEKHLRDLDDARPTFKRQPAGVGRPQRPQRSSWLGTKTTSDLIGAAGWGTKTPSNLIGAASWDKHIAPTPNGAARCSPPGHRDQKRAPSCSQRAARDQRRAAGCPRDVQQELRAATGCAHHRRGRSKADGHAFLVSLEVSASAVTSRTVGAPVGNAPWLSQPSRVAFFVGSQGLNRGHQIRGWSVEGDVRHHVVGDQADRDVRVGRAAVPVGGDQVFVRQERHGGAVLRRMLWQRWHLARTTVSASAKGHELRSAVRAPPLAGAPRHRAMATSAVDRWVLAGTGNSETKHQHSFGRLSCAAPWKGIRHPHTRQKETARANPCWCRAASCSCVHQPS